MDESFYYYTSHAPVCYQYDYPSPPIYTQYEPTVFSVLPSDYASPRHKHAHAHAHSHSHYGSHAHGYSRSRSLEPSEGHCFLLLFKQKHWAALKRRFGPNSLLVINTPDCVIRQFMLDHPRMVSSRRDLQRFQTGPYLTHIAPGGGLSPWDLV